MTQVATLANGCFWCTEAVFQRIDGVEKVVSGYSGGSVENPTYEEVSEGTTGHAEALQVTFDPEKINYKELLNIFFKTHDPTTLNRQGNDIGTQYRSAIFFHDLDQKKIAEEYIKELEDEKIFNDPIVTEVSEFKNFYPAEDYHQNFYNSNGNHPYCRIIIDPKIKKLMSEFSEKLKK